jgi:hypothetical protein
MPLLGEIEALLRVQKKRNSMIQRLALQLSKCSTRSNGNSIDDLIGENNFCVSF